ncbi:uncharacterized protein LOC142991734 [Genypterus blacodes]|uniref:uncharacterized protein LOC142991734 n=1 Tax=Genypterus blacodes TaxID=154954 RepID=UPI003F75BD7C
MILIYSVVLFLFFKGSSCRDPCIPGSAQRPYIMVPPLEEGKENTVICRVHCPRRAFSHIFIDWTLTSSQGSTEELQSQHKGFDSFKLSFTPRASDHKSNLTCVANFGYGMAETTVTLTVRSSAKILNSSGCAVDGQRRVCVCITQGNPLPVITWHLADSTNYSVTTSESEQTVKSTIIISDMEHNLIKCISNNQLGTDEGDFFNNNKLDWTGILSGTSQGRQEGGTILPWVIAGLSLSLNLALLIKLVIWKQRKRKPKKPCREEDTYATLNRAELDGGYDVISPRQR